MVGFTLCTLEEEQLTIFGRALRSGVSRHFYPQQYQLADDTLVFAKSTFRTLTTAAVNAGLVALTR